jgi:hypothetical protein
MKNLFLVVLCALLLPACMLTNSTGQPVVLTSATAPELIIAEMKKGCAALMANPALVKIAVDTATAALKDTSGIVASTSNAASIGCSLLVPPPPTPVTAPTG